MDNISPLPVIRGRSIRAPPSPDSMIIAQTNTSLYNCFLVYFRSVLLDQLWAIVDGCPVKQGHVLFVWLSDIISCFHQLLAAFQDAEPDRSHTENRDFYLTGVSLRRKVWLTGKRSRSAGFYDSFSCQLFPTYLLQRYLLDRAPQLYCLVFSSNALIIYFNSQQTTKQ